jgi:RNA polymerase sigma factor (sigma-70 family)
VRKLPQRQRACVVLRYFEDLAEADIAEVMDCSVGTVKSQLSKARAKLERELELTLKEKSDE